MRRLLQQRLSLRRLRNLHNKPGLPIRNVTRILYVLILMFGWIRVSAQTLTKHQQDTTSLSRYEYFQHRTNNGTACIYMVSNPSNANIAIAVNTGAPETFRCDNDSLFNGTHLLVPGQQIIAVGDFKGKQITTMNLSPQRTFITVMLYCPAD